MNKKILSKVLIATVLVGGVNFAPVTFNADNLQIISVAHAEIQNVTASDTAMFDFGEDDTQIVNTVKNVAKMRATQAAKEKAGVFIKSFSKTVNSVLTDDEISAYTSNNIEILNTTYKKIPIQAHDVKGNDTGKIGFMYEATVTAKIDTSGLTAYIQQDSQDRQNAVQQNKIAQKNIQQINQDFDKLQNSSESAEQIKIKLASVNDRMLANEKIDEGNKLYNQKNYQGAISKYSDALKLNPNSAKAYYNRALCYDNLQDYSKAIADYTEAITYNGSDLDAYFNRGIIYVGLKDYDKAISDFKKIIRLKSSYVSAYVNLGVTYYFVGDYEQAIENFNKVIEIAKKNSSAYMRAHGNRGIVYTEMKDYKKALADLNKAVELGTKDGEAYYCRGVCNKALGRNAEAEKDFAKARELGYTK